VNGITVLGASRHLLIYAAAFPEQARICHVFWPGSVLPSKHYRLVLRGPLAILRGSGEDRAAAECRHLRKV
jgi:hypothetical protein